MIVVDSSVWIDQFRDRVTDAVSGLRAISRAPDILVGDVVLLELLQGARDDGHARDLDHHLNRFETVSMLDVSLASAAAANYRHLRALEFTVRKTPNLIIGTFCI